MRGTEIYHRHASGPEGRRRRRGKHDRFARQVDFVTVISRLALGFSAPTALSCGRAGRHRPLLANHHYPLLNVFRPQSLCVYAEPLARTRRLKSSSLPRVYAQHLALSSSTFLQPGWTGTVQSILSGALSRCHRSADLLRSSDSHNPRINSCLLACT